MRAILAGGTGGGGARRALGAAGVLLLAALAVGCAGNGEPDEGVAAPPERATPAAPRSEVSAAAPSEPAPRPSASAADTGWTAGVVRRDHPVRAVATLREVRVAAHDGFDRIVFQFDGEVIPGYHLEYVDRPVRACGSGDVVEVAGDAWLSVRMEPARAHDDNGQVTLRTRSLRPNLPVVREAILICDFEAQVEWVLGASTPGRFRVLELRDPARLVVDVRS